MNSLRTLILFILVLVCASPIRCNAYSIITKHYRSYNKPTQTKTHGELTIPTTYYRSSLLCEFETWNNPALTTHEQIPSKPRGNFLGAKVQRVISDCFLPVGKVSRDYFVYSRWRALQRFISATNNVFGTQALMIALGITKRKVGTTMATTWVLKDVLGKVSRIFWASRFGKKFDENAKRWRFRSSLLYAFGNCLELLTYMFPSLFLFTAAMANASKQVSMLTSSATRNTIYKSFSSGLENIGDITAKGEAQGAVIDIMGIATGILISEAIIHKRSLCFLIYSVLVIADIICVSQEIRSVVFKTFNIERAFLAIWSLVNQDDENFSPRKVAARENLFFSPMIDDSIIRSWDTLANKNPLMIGKVKELTRANDNFMVFLEIKQSILWRKWNSNLRQRFDLEPIIILGKHANSVDLLQAIIVICYCKREVQHINLLGKNLESLSVEIVEKAYTQFRENNVTILNLLRTSGWEIEKFVCSMLE